MDTPNLTEGQQIDLRAAATLLINRAREASAEATDLAGSHQAATIACANIRAEAMAMEAGALALGLLARINARPDDQATLADYIERINLATGEHARHAATAAAAIAALASTGRRKPGRKA